MLGDRPARPVALGEEKSAMITRVLMGPVAAFGLIPAGPTPIVEGEGSALSQAGQ